jgi:hypothetical protein
MLVKYIHGYYPEETINVTNIEVIDDPEIGPYFRLHNDGKIFGYFATHLEGPDSQGVLTAICPENF